MADKVSYLAMACMALTGILCFVIPVALLLYLKTKKGADLLPFFVGCAVMLLFALVLGLVTMLYYRLKLGESSKAAKERILRITIPESLDYTDVFDDVFETYTSEHKVRQVKTTNMGSMFKLTYDITLKNIEDEKKLLDDIRVRNGNLEVSLSLEEENSYEL